MNDSFHTIEATKREQIGKNYANKLRRRSLIPGILNGKGSSTPIELDPKLLSKVWKSGKKFNLTFEGKTTFAEIKEIQVHPVKRYALHVDLVYAS